MAGLGAQELIKTRIDGLGAHRCAVQGIGSLGDLPQCGGDRIHVALGWVFSSRTLSAPNPTLLCLYVYVERISKQHQQHKQQIMKGMDLVFSHFFF